MVTPNKRQKLTRSWEEVAKEAQDYRDASLAQVKPGLPDLLEKAPECLRSNAPEDAAMEQARAVLLPRDVQITEMSPEDLIQALAAGELSATDVTSSFLRRAVVAQKLVRALLLLMKIFLIWRRQIASQNSYPDEL